MLDIVYVTSMHWRNASMHKAAKYVRNFHTDLFIL